MFAMFCNLLYNPQVRHLIALGADLDLPTCDELEAFLRDGLEETELLGAPLRRVVGTARVFPVAEGFDAERLRRTLSFRALGKLSTPGPGGRAAQALAELPVSADEATRVKVDIPVALPDDYTFLPSDVAGHQVLRRTPLECWDELVARTLRFGHPVNVKGRRIELLNAKAIIAEPAEDPGGRAARARVRAQRLARLPAADVRLRRSTAPTTRTATASARTSGTTRSRPRSTACARIRRPRDAYISLWDTAYDLAGRPQPPVPDDALLPPLTGRAHADGDLPRTQPADGLAAERVRADGDPAPRRRGTSACRSGRSRSSATRSAADPSSDRFPAAAARARRPRAPARARRGPDGLLRGQPGRTTRSSPSTASRAPCSSSYRSDRADRIAHQIAADMAVSLPSHALWLGRELAHKEHQLRARRDLQPRGAAGPPA